MRNIDVISIYRYHREENIDLISILILENIAIPTLEGFGITNDFLSSWSTVT